MLLTCKHSSASSCTLLTDGSINVGVTVTLHSGSAHFLKYLIAQVPSDIQREEDRLLSTVYHENDSMCAYYYHEASLA